MATFTAECSPWFMRLVSLNLLNLDYFENYEEYISASFSKEIGGLLWCVKLLDMAYLFLGIKKNRVGSCV